ncbi:Gfo/Idh/MocA family oxidoreductase [Anaerovibrio sp.]|uniref:Gfo/Idh/MocA family protein n=1 Tax=Anaerovibrio sp. TaxID=1872532 RepID=UPI0025BF2968|nr:Gfo/Idh/MocA family oxidoreductase [Anaerovibrio sp.]MBR2143595.1 Gfo/Idh/MocA family oxidoreductase [Anaerovibrio sp.]
MKYALIGCGRIAVNHIRAALHNHLDMVAVCDVDLRQVNNLLKKTGYDKSVACYVDYKTMIENHPDLELVSIATDSGSHARIALYCIEKGIHVIIEKPIAMNLADANAIIQRSKEKNVKVSACHQNRFNIAVQEMRMAIEKGKFGKISHGSVHVRWNRDRAYYNQANWRSKWASDGGALMNQCIHGIDLLRWMMGDEVDEVYGTIRQRFHDYLECEDVGVAVVKFKNGAIGTIEGTVNVYPENLEETLYFFGETGTVKLGGTSCNRIDIWNFADATDNEKSGLQENVGNIYGNGHMRLFEDVIEAVRNNQEPYVDAVAGRNALEMVLAVYKSQLTGQPVKFPLKEFDVLEMTGTFNK